MKTLNRLFIFAGIILFISSCKKEDSPAPIVNPNPDTVSDNSSKFRLISVERRKDDSSLVYSFGFQYDASGRITKIFAPENNPQGIMATVSYNGNDAVFAQPATNPFPGVFGTDTIRFVLDAENKALKRTENRYLQDDDTLGNHPIRTYSFDTTVYEYNAEGLLVKETRQNRDSTIWTNNGATSLTDVLYSTTATHHISGGNVVAINSVAVVTPGNYVTEKNVSFEYTHSYPNNAALGNPAIMNEMHLFYDWPLNNHYKNMPDKMTAETINKDGNGNTVHTESSTYLSTLTLDKNGYLGTYFDSNFTGGKWYYLYGK